MSLSRFTVLAMGLVAGVTSPATRRTPMPTPAPVDVHLAKPRGPGALLSGKLSEVLPAATVSAARIIVLRAVTTAPDHLDVLNIRRMLSASDASFSSGDTPATSGRAFLRASVLESPWFEALVLTATGDVFFFEADAEWACLTSPSGRGCWRPRTG